VERVGAAVIGTPLSSLLYDNHSSSCHDHFSNHPGMFYTGVLEGSSRKERIVERLSLAQWPALPDITFPCDDVG